MGREHSLEDHHPLCTVGRAMISAQDFLDARKKALDIAEAEFDRVRHQYQLAGDRLALARKQYNQAGSDWLYATQRARLLAVERGEAGPDMCRTCGHDSPHVQQDGDECWCGCVDYIPAADRLTEEDVEFHKARGRAMRARAGFTDEPPSKGREVTDA